MRGVPTADLPCQGCSARSNGPRVVAKTTRRGSLPSPGRRKSPGGCRQIPKVGLRRCAPRTPREGS
ncbi:hypothetical protein SGM_1724 [Streptomyces griseoaurantiacus M045]|uniref:Uncharacterized protein n=1 Tax=Streptomyces griseoaurantiacus M045 TaxID=996637 RepID=F3NF10_9ACTN|nr:hypothetical protein SGM_1724 [Streptomyces griseoaurantiacus M045]